MAAVLCRWLVIILVAILLADHRSTASGCMGSGSGPVTGTCEAWCHNKYIGILACPAGCVYITHDDLPTRHHDLPTISCLGTPCPAGLFCEAGCTSSSGTGICPAGVFCEAGCTSSSGTGGCPAGSYYTAATGLKTVSECSGTACPAGLFCEAGCTSSSGSGRCPAGSYYNSTGATSSATCLGIPCPAGLFCEAGCTSSKGTGKCPEGSFYSKLGAKSILECSGVPCPTGSVPTSHVDGPPTCEVKSVTVCRPGSGLLPPSTKKANDAVCEKCAVGWISSSFDASPCILHVGAVAGAVVGVAVVVAILVFALLVRRHRSAANKARDRWSAAAPPRANSDAQIMLQEVLLPSGEQYVEVMMSENKDAITDCKVDTGDSKSNVLPPALSVTLPPPPPWSVAHVTAQDSPVMDKDVAECIMSYSASVQVFRDRYRLPDDIDALVKRGRQRLNEYYSEIERSYSPFLPAEEFKRRRTECLKMDQDCNEDTSHQLGVRVLGYMEETLQLLCVRNAIRGKAKGNGMSGYARSLIDKGRITEHIGDKLHEAARFRNVNIGHESVGSGQGVTINPAKTHEFLRLYLDLLNESCVAAAAVDDNVSEDSGGAEYPIDSKGGDEANRTPTPQPPTPWRSEEGKHF